MSTQAMYRATVASAGSSLYVRITLWLKMCSLPCTVAMSDSPYSRERKDGPLPSRQGHERAQRRSPLRGQRRPPPALAVVAQPELERALVLHEANVNRFGLLRRLVEPLEVLRPEPENQIPGIADRGRELGEEDRPAIQPLLAPIRREVRDRVPAGAHH